jgi:hypothetical protein
MVWDSLTKDEVEKLKKQINKASETMLKDKAFLDYFSITEEEAKAQLEKIQKAKE